MPSLAKYRKMRDFTATAEPRGAAGPKRKLREAAPLSYVIQKHAASRLHYDFRLELDGVLLSWAVPKGPSLDPSVKRLAVETEPHPLEYGGFEGTIPKGHYGGGTVMVWDRGSWTPEGDARKDYERGRMTFRLDGEKLHGAFHLVRTGGRSAEGKNWLLFKSRDEYAREGEDAIVEEEPDSVLTGRNLDAIAQGKPAPKRARQSGARSPRKTNGKSAEAEGAGDGEAAGGRHGKRSGKAPASAAKPVRGKPKRLEAVPAAELATLVDAAPAGEDWIHELKFDGYRLLVRIEDGEVQLFTRNGHDWTERMPGIAAAFAKLPVDTALVDGEVVVLDARGLSDFQALQNSLRGENESGLVFYAFDLLHWDGRDLATLPLLERKAALAELFAKSELPETLRVSEHVQGRGPEFFAQACKLGVEGIVSKRATSPYRPGRGHDWLKVKCLARQEFVLVGYTDPGGTRSHFGALLLGTRRDGELVYSGKVGTGFTAASLRELYEKLAPLGTDEPPVTNPPRGADARGVHWVEPKLVAEIAFTGFTTDGMLRHPTFQGLREDKTAAEVKLELPAKSASRDAGGPSPSKKTANMPPQRKQTKSSTAARAATHVAPDDYPLTNPDKVLYPEQGITKRELLDYYALVAERMLPHVKNRPLTLVRCPNGRGKPCFFQKHPGEGTPKGLRSIAIREKEGKAPYSVLDDELGLFGLVQLGALEIHTWGSRADDFEHPDLLVFDLDPDPSVPFSAVIAAAQRLRSLFEQAKLETFVKTAGGKGLHVCLPIVPDLDWDEAKAFTNRVADAVAAEAPGKYVTTVSKAARKGKIFIDYLRNGRGATFIAPYSTRARENAPIAVPLDWDELTPRLRPDQFTVRNVRERLEKLRDDPFLRMTKLRQRLRPESV